MCKSSSGVKRTMTKNIIVLNWKACEIFQKEMFQKYNCTSPTKPLLNDHINQELGSYAELTALFQEQTEPYVYLGKKNYTSCSLFFCSY